MQAKFEDAIGRAQQITVTFSGLPNRPNLTYVVRLYDNQPSGVIEAIVGNNGTASTIVQEIRCLETIGSKAIDLGTGNAADRVLADTLSEDLSALQIYDLSTASSGIHLAVGTAKIREDLRFSAIALESGVPALTYHWSSGDGVSAEGAIQNHSYTLAGTFTVKLVAEGIDGIAAEENAKVVVNGLQEIAPLDATWNRPLVPAAKSHAAYAPLRCRPI